VGRYVQHTASDRTAAEAIIPWVFREYYRIREIFEEPGGNSIRDTRSVPLAVSCGTLAKTGISIVDMVDARIKSGGKKRNRVERVIQEKHKFIIQTESTQFQPWPVVWLVNRLAF
jgi:hypothetical protein